MFSIEPYTAKRLVARSNDDRGIDMNWDACCVIGITEKDGEPQYIVECFKDGGSWLEKVEYVRRSAPTA